ncbi:MAG: TolC family outer membrane protein [Pseudomonadales bacterium]|nr:TolC family outer membrane protein [Pseudomonadales bacterium]
MNKSYLKRTLSALALPACLACASLAQASDLKDVYDLAVQNDPQLGAAKAAYMARREVVTQARSGLLPTITATASTAENKRTLLDPNAGSANYNDNGWQAVLRQPVFRLGNWFQFEQSKNIEAQALAQFTAEQQELIFRVADSYLNILQAQDLLSAANAERSAVQRQLEQVQQRFDVGLVAITDVLESTAAFDSSTVNVIEAEGAQAVTFETLLRLTGQPFTEVAGLSADFPVEFPEPRDEEAWVKAALQQNYSLIAAQEAVRAAEKDLQIARSGHLPTIDAQISYARSNTDDQNYAASTVAGTELKQRSAALQLTMPLYAGGATSSRARQSGYLLEQAQRNFDLTQRQVVENTRTLYSALNTDVARVKARLRGIESSQSALDATQTGYEVGTRNIVDVLLAQQRLFQAQFQYASARYQYIKDTLRLKQVVGTLSPDDIYNLSNYLTEDKKIGKIVPTTR